MAKQPVPNDGFEHVFLEYLRLRFEFEPLPHYVMAAISICDTKGTESPEFVRAFLFWMVERFLFEPGWDNQGRDMPMGAFPILSWNNNPLDAQWRRYADCHDLLFGLREGDVAGALERQGGAG